ncbi:MAG TPA: hypothetical protein VH500_00045, partial [Nitrososphaeraceae archaeon]
MIEFRISAIHHTNSTLSTFFNTEFKTLQKSTITKNKVSVYFVVQWACGGGALPLESASLNVPAAFSWNSRLDWST